MFSSKEVSVIASISLQYTLLWFSNWFSLFGPIDQGYGKSLSSSQIYNKQRKSIDIPCVRFVASRCLWFQWLPVPGSLITFSRFQHLSIVILLLLEGNIKIVFDENEKNIITLVSNSFDTSPLALTIKMNVGQILFLFNWF